LPKSEGDLHWGSAGDLKAVCKVYLRKTLHRFKNLSYDAWSQANLGIKGDSNPDKDSGGDSRAVSQSAFYLLYSYDST
jgi:hypothetical protein